MTRSATFRGAALLLLLVHAAQCWDASNIWFPDTNNPVFYNMTFYQQAAQTVTADNTDNHIPGVTPEEPPPAPPRRQRPPVFNRLPDETVTSPRRPNVVQRIKKPVRDRPQSTSTSPDGGRFPDADAQSSDLNRLVAQQRAFVRHEQDQRDRLFGARESNPRSPIERLAEQQRAFIRNEQTGHTVSSPLQAATSRRHDDVFARNQPEVAVGYKTVPLETTSAGSRVLYPSRRPAGNRLRRTENEDRSGGATNHFDNGWSQTRRPESTANRRSFTRPVEENRRRWNNAGTTVAVNGDPTYRVEDNVIAGRETGSKPNGPSKCVWAIISCCKPSSPQIRYTCFETLGCHGAFWDTNPCSKEMTMAAVQATADFYNIPRSSVD